VENPHRITHQNNPSIRKGIKWVHIVKRPSRWSINALLWSKEKDQLRIQKPDLQQSEIVPV
jgi:hypothetical protein